MTEKNEYVVAIDLGTSKVTTLVGRAADEGRIEVLASAVSDSLSGVVRGEIKNTEHISKAVSETIDKIGTEVGIAIREAWVGVSGPYIKSSAHSGYIFIENNDGEVRESDVQRLNESMNHVQIPVGETIIHILPQEYTVDEEAGIREPAGMIGRKLEAAFNIVTGDRNAISRIDKCLGRFEIGVAGHVLDPLAAAEAVLVPDEKELGVCVVDIGGGTTDVCIVHDNIVRHAAIIPLGGNIINKDIRSYGILERRVEALKVKFGSAVGSMERADKFITIPGLNARDPKEISCRNLASIIEARMLDIVDCVPFEIKRAGYTGRLGAGIVLTGGGAQTRNLDVLFREHTQYDVRVAVPDTHVTEESAELVNSPAYSVAVGLLLKAAGAATQKSGAHPPVVVRTAAAPATVKTAPTSEANDTPAEKVESTRSSPRRWNELAAARREESDEEPFETELEKEDAEKPKSWWQRAKDRLTSTFEVIDDDI
jgi:cell division protein FtsA